MSLRKRVLGRICIQPPAGLLAAFFLCVVLPHQLAAVENSRELVSYCEAAVKGVVGTGDEIEIPATKEALLCWGYVEAFQDLARLADQSGRKLLGVCPPEQGTLLDLVRSFVAYAHSHWSELSDNTAISVLQSLQQAYPCSQRSQSSRRRP